MLLCHAFFHRVDGGIGVSVWRGDRRPACVWPACGIFISGSYDVVRGPIRLLGHGRPGDLVAECLPHRKRQACRQETSRQQANAQQAKAGDGPASAPANNSLMLYPLFFCFCPWSGSSVIFLFFVLSWFCSHLIAAAFMTAQRTQPAIPPSLLAQPSSLSSLPPRVIPPGSQQLAT